MKRIGIWGGRGGCFNLELNFDQKIDTRYGGDYIKVRGRARLKKIITRLKREYGVEVITEDLQPGSKPVHLGTHVYEKGVPVRIQ